MKNITRFFGCILICFVFFKPVHGQGWEFSYSDSIFDNYSNQFLLLSGSNNGARLAYQDILSNSSGSGMVNFDIDGEFIGYYGVPGTYGWNLIQSDRSGATYWWSIFKIRKINSNDQIEWTYDFDSNAGAFGAYDGPDGSTYVKYINTNNEHVIDIITKDGILSNQFSFTDGWPDIITPTYDFGMIYSDYSSNDPKIFTKLDNQGNIIWSKDFDTWDRFLGGSVDGSTYYSSVFGHTTGHFYRLHDF
jgi:hypothetical protein